MNTETDGTLLEIFKNEDERKKWIGLPDAGSEVKLMWCEKQKTGVTITRMFPCTIDHYKISTGAIVLKAIPNNTKIP